MGPGSAVLPHDAIVQLFPGGDLPDLPVNSLIEIPGIWQPTESTNIFGPGSMVVCRPTIRIDIGGTTSTVPFSLGMAVVGEEADANDDYIMVSWWIPGTSAKASMQPGKKAKMMDIFGSWEPYDELKAGAAAAVTVPGVQVPKADVLLMNVELEADSQIPFDVFDELRTSHDIDVSRISLSITHRGNLYRAHVLQTV